MAEPGNLATISNPPRTERTQRRLGSGLTPQAITSVQRQADLGDMYLWADLLDEIRQADPHLHGELTKREQAVSGAPYEIRPGVGTRAAAAVELCQEAISNLEVPAGSLAVGFHGMLTHLQTGIYHGRAVAEIEWAVRGRKVLPKTIWPIHARRLSWSLQDSWALHVWDASSAGGSPFGRYPGVATSDPRIFPRGKLIVHLPRLFGTYPTREGVGRGVVWYSAFKRWSVRDWLAFAEWAGRGLRVGKYATGRDPQKTGRANEEDKQALEDAIVAMSSTVATIIPDVTDLTVITATDNGVHSSLVRLCNTEISKMVLGGVISAEGGERASLGLSKVNKDVAQFLAHADGQALSEVLRRDFFMPIVRENFGDRAAVPEIVFQVEPRDSLDSRARRLAAYVDRGLRVPATWIRDVEGIPDPKEGEEVLVSTQAAPTRGIDQPDRNEEHPCPPEGMNPMEFPT